MRATLVGEQADRFYRTVTFVAWGLVSIFFSFVALPLASSSPYPTPSRSDWAQPRTVRIVAASAAPAAPASSSIPESPATFSLASASSVPVVREQTVPLVNSVRTLSIRRPIGEPSEQPEPPIVTASLGGLPTPELPHEPQPSATPTLPDEVTASAPAELPTVSTPRPKNAMDEVDQYLWSVYQRQPVKKDRGGDFSWKDPAAAARAGMTLQAYVIMGMERDLREVMYHAGKAMDEAGIEWTIVSAFRDDYRQSIAAGLKARTGYSRHGGSRATGGYGHGRAIDVGHVDRKRSNEVYRWIDANGARFGISRPIRHFDPPHVEPRADWRRIAVKLRRERTGSTEVATEEPAEETSPVRTRTRVARAGRSLRSRRHR